MDRFSFTRTCLRCFSDMKPKFVKCFADVGEVMKTAFKQYINETEAGSFPGEEHVFKIAEDIIDKLY